MPQQRRDWEQLLLRPQEVGGSAGLTAALSIVGLAVVRTARLRKRRRQQYVRTIVHITLRSLLTSVALAAAATITFAASPEPTTAAALQQALGPGVGVFEAKAGEVAVGLPYLKRIELTPDYALVTVRNDGTAPLAPWLELGFFNKYGMRLCRTTASFEADTVPPGGVKAVQVAISMPNLADIFATSTVALPTDWKAVRFVAVQPVPPSGQPVAGSSLAQRLENARTPPQPTIDPRRPPPRPQLVKTVQSRPGILVDKKLGTQNVGAAAYDAKWSNYGAYLQRMIETVQLQWERIIIEQKANPVVGSLVAVKFVMNDEGRIVDIGVVETSANDTATRAAVSAITDRAPYGPWTDDMKAALGDKQEITFTFYYQ